MKQLKWPISLFSLCAVESFQLRRAEFDENSENLNAFFSMFSNGMTYFEGYHVRPMFYSYGGLKLKIVAVGFFLDTDLPTGFMHTYKFGAITFKRIVQMT